MMLDFIFFFVTGFGSLGIVGCVTHLYVQFLWQRRKIIFNFQYSNTFITGLIVAVVCIFVIPKQKKIFQLNRRAQRFKFRIDCIRGCIKYLLSFVFTNLQIKPLPTPICQFTTHHSTPFPQPLKRRIFFLRF